MDLVRNTREKQDLHLVRLLHRLSMSPIRWADFNLDKNGTVSNAHFGLYDQGCEPRSFDPPNNHRL